MMLLKVNRIVGIWRKKDEKEEVKKMESGEKRQSRNGNGGSDSDYCGFGRTGYYFQRTDHSNCRFPVWENYITDIFIIGRDMKRGQKIRKDRLAKGGITVFLTGILMILMSFILICVDATRFYAIQVEAECIADMGLDSIFAEYNRELLEQYDLFFIDTSYGYSQPAYQRTEAHLADYMEQNLQPGQDILTWNGRDFLGMGLEEAELLEASLATDNEGRDVHYQAVEYMRDKVGLAFIEDMQRQMETVYEYDMDDRNVEEEAEQIEEEIRGVELPQEQLEDGSFTEVSVDNPADSVNCNRFKGILYLVTEDASQISDHVINIANYASQRECNRGTGAASEETDSAADEILFDEYLLEKCAYYTKTKDTGELSYEIEYILGGRSSDIENLKWVAGRLILLREVANVSYLYTDREKMEEADLLAWGLSIVALKPQLQPMIKNSVLFAWAYAESVQDVRLLLSGNKVPLLKTKDTWHLSLDHMLNYQEHLEQSEDAEGLDYATYLRILLLLENKEEKTKRFLDVVEMNLRKTEGNRFFRIDGCMDAVTAQIVISGEGNTEVHLIKEYSYLNR